MLPFQQLARKATSRKATLSIPQKSENVKFILQKFPKKVDFAESLFMGDIKCTTNFCKCQTDLSETALYYTTKNDVCQIKNPVRTA